MFNYENIGNKIKSLARTLFIIEAIAEIITGFALMIADEDLIFYGFLIIVIGPIVAWVSSWLLYGFGQLIENSDIIAAEYNRKNEKHEKVVAKSNEKKQVQRTKEIKAAIASPKVDEYDFIDITCPNCKADLCYPKVQLQSGEELTCPICDAPFSI